RQPIKRVVDFDRRKLARVKPEHPVILHVSRIERPFPLLECEAARSGVKLHDTFDTFDGFAAGSSGFVVAVRLALRASMRSRILPPLSGVMSAVMSWPSIFL